MSLRIRLFLMMGCLVALLIVGQWWWIRGLTRDLSTEVGEVAVWVGNNVASAFVEDQREPCVGSGCAKVIVTRREVTRRGDAVTTGERVFVFKKPIKPSDAALPTAQAGSAGDAESAATDATWVQAPPQALERSPVRILSDDDGDAPTASLVSVHDVEIAVAPESDKQTRDRHLILRLQTDQATDPATGLPATTTRAATARRPLETRIPIPDRGVESRLERFSQRLLLGSAGLLGVGLLAAMFIAHRVATPLRRLSDASRRLGDGALGTQVAVAGGDTEVGHAMDAFNQMSSRLAVLDAQSRSLAARQHLSEIGEIARGLAHTLRNPLNALGLTVDALTSGPLPAERAQALNDTARRQIRRIDQGIRSFLTLASQGGGETEPVDVATLARDVALEASQDAGAHKVAVRVDATEGLAPLPGVAPELRAVLHALVVNAVEATPEGESVSIALQAEPSTSSGRDALDDGLRIEVDDRGPGLPPAVRDRLFTPHLSTKAHGTGMGLFLAQRIATTRYGGSLALDDRSDGGTRATLRLFPRRDEVAHD